MKADSSSDDDQVVALLLAERQALEMIADGAALTDVLEELCRIIDEQQPDVIATFMLTDTDGKRLRRAAGPRVPAGWTKAITSLQIIPDTGSCGMPVFRKQPVIVSDIATDPLIAVADYRSLALSHGLRAVWSQPLISRDDEMLGSFAMYYTEPREPSAGDLQLISRVAHIAMIAVQRDRAQKALECAYQEIKQSEEKLRQEEEELRQITDLIPQMITVLSPDGRAIYANRSVLEYTGLSLEEVQAEDFRSRVFHPDDVQRLREERGKSLAGTLPFENEQRALGKDGKYRWFLNRYNPLLDEAGKVVRWYVTGTDIDERKRAEDRARNETVALREEIARLSMFEEIVGSSEALHKVLTQVARVAPADSTVLILGETGTGKELIARAIHKRSKRAARAQQAGIKRTDLQRHDLSVPGREVVQVRVDIAPGVVAPNGAELGYQVTMVKDATADYSDEEMHAALDINIPNYASAIVTTSEIVDSITALEKLGISAQQGAS